MALTRITKGVIKPNENYDTHNINSTGIITATGGNITGNLTVGGVLTYEDVSSIDAVGIITANQGIHIGAGLSAVGVGTFSGADIDDFISVGSNIHLGSAGVVTATSYRGDGSQLTGIVAGLSTISGVVNVSNDIKIGTGVTITPAGAGFYAGVVTATTFDGELVATNLTGALPAISGVNLTNVNADTVDGIQAASFARSDATDTLTGELTLSNNLLKFSGTTNDRTLIHFIKSNEIKWRLLQNSYNAGGGDNLNFDRVNGTGIFMVDGYRVLTTLDINAQASGAVHSGISTFQDIDVDGHTNLDNVSIAGVCTATTFSGSGASLTSIANASISASAAIAGSKITPNFGTQTLNAGLGYFSNHLNTTGNFSMTGGSVEINLNRDNHTPNYKMRLTGGSYTTMNFRIQDSTNSEDRFIIRQGGQIEIPGDLGIGHPVNFSATNISKFGSYSTLHIKGPSNNGAAIRLQDNGDTADSDDFVIYKNYAAAYLRVNGTDPLIAYLNGDERLRITSTGGLTSSGTGATLNLTNSGTNATEQTATFLTSNSGTHNRIVIKTSTNNGGDPYIKFDAGGQDMVVGTRYAGTTNNLLVLGPGLDPDTTYGVFVKGNGRVGVGSDNPQHPLDVFGNIRSHQQTPSLYLQTTDNAAQSAVIRFGDAGSFQRASLQYDFSNENHLIIKMGGAGNNVERMRIRGTDGAIKIGGHSANRDMGGLSYQKVHIEGTDGGSSAIGIFNNQNSTGSSGLYLGKSRGTSVGSNTIVQDNDTLGSIIWVGADGNDAISQGAQIRAKVDGTPASNDMPCRLELATTPDGGSATTITRMTIGADGHVALRQHGNSKTYFFSSGKAGGYSNLTIVIDAHAWHSFVITVAHGGYAGSWTTAKYMGYENGSMYYANEGTETTDSNGRNVTHSQNPGGGHKHRIEITGGMGTHPVCELRITIGGDDAYIDSGDITFTWA